MSTVPTPPATPEQPWYLANKKKIVLVLMALAYIPYHAFKNMDERKAADANAQVITLDERVPDVKLTITAKDFFGTVKYENGTQYARRGLGILVVTLEDNQKNPDQFKAFNLKDTDFPILAFFDSSGHDASGTALEIRRTKDGSSVYKADDIAPFAVLVLPLPDGRYKIRDIDGKTQVVNADEWNRLYMGMMPQFTAEQLAKMTDAELQKYGYTKMSRDEFSKKYGNADNKGVRGKVVRVGGAPNPVEPVYCPVHVFKGTVKPFEKYDKNDDRIAQSIHTEKDGSFSVNLPPGTYTVVVELEGGKLRGNAFDPTVWPTVTVGIGWVDYEFRVPAGVK